MSDLQSLVNTLRRPRLLIRAARFGLQDYNRSAALRRLIKATAPPPPRGAVAALLSAEADLEEARKTGDARYSVARHVDMLIALICEARLLTQPQS